MEGDGELRFICKFEKQWQLSVQQFVFNEDINVSGLTDKITNQVNVLGVFSGSAQITLSGDVTGTAAATTITQIDGGSI